MTQTKFKTQASYSLGLTRATLNKLANLSGTWFCYLVRLIGGNGIEHVLNKYLVVL